MQSWLLNCLLHDGELLTDVVCVCILCWVVEDGDWISHCHAHQWEETHQEVANAALCRLHFAGYGLEPQCQLESWIVPEEPCPIHSL